MQLSFSRINRILLTPASAIVFLGWVYFLVSSAALPDPVAIHLGLSGQADGFISRDSYLLVVVPAILIPWMLQVLFYLLQKNVPLIRKFITAVLSIIYWMLFAIMFSATASQVGLFDALQSNFPFFLIAILLILIPISLWFSLAFPSIELGNQLVVRLRGIKVLSIPMKSVISVKTASMSSWNYGGLGIRVSGKTLAFIPSKGEGVVFSLKTGEKIAVRSKQASEVLTLALAKLGG
ncbi:unannotated protein [freshwater metagenome]|uniref:Unannotated protein n=1 Tax=freshwater metagenome TaxID=449393 RepID=A0A6J7FNC5_9ZZZZ|nr:DUF1648 domain-containing protein [Actinomycetota bacterium]